MCVNTKDVFPPPSDVCTLNIRRPIVYMLVHYFLVHRVLFLESYVWSVIFNCFSYLRIFPTERITRSPACLLSRAVRFGCFTALRPIMQIWIKWHEYSCGAQAELWYATENALTFRHSAPRVSFLMFLVWASWGWSNVRRCCGIIRRGRTCPLMNI